MKPHLLLTAALLTLTLTPVANAHLVTRPKNDSREATHASQLQNLAHARYVCNNGRAAVKSWHCAWVPILERESRETRPVVLRSVPDIIRAVFGSAGSAAVTVASCETGGTFDVNAQNGQYLGLFQMGGYARSRYGHGPDAWTQSRAAYAYYRDAGWSPWQCHPGGGLRW